MAGKFTALVVDDEKVIRDGCTRILNQEGFQVLTATSGKEALEVLAHHSVDIILCDLKMPGMGALEVLEETRVRYPDIPVVIITGHGTLDCALDCMKQGACDFVTKPFRADHLLMVTRRALDGTKEKA